MFVKYNGSYSDLCTEAANSLFDVRMPTSTNIVVDKDDFGRRIYLFYGSSIMARDNIYEGKDIFAFMISQKTDDTYVYYYPDVNFIVQKWPEGIYTNTDEKQLLKKLTEEISNEAIKELKTKNDWGMPINESKCIKIKITQYDTDSEKLVSQKLRQKVYNETCEYGRSKSEYALSYLTSDAYNRHIYFFRAVDANNNYTKSYVVMFKPDSSYEIAEILDLWNYQDELKLFKSRNNWNKSLN
jgi:hypothetical protein